MKEEKKNELLSKVDIDIDIKSMVIIGYHRFIWKMCQLNVSVSNNQIIIELNKWKPF